MPRLDARDTARLLTELSQRTALAGGNPYRARAYARAAETIAALATPLAEIVAEKRLREIPGVGDTIAEVIEGLHLSGTHPTLEKMRADVPAGVVAMLTIPGLRAEKVAKLHKDLGITSLEELEAAARADRLAGVKGLGPALQAKVLEGLAIRQRTSGARHIHRAGELLAFAEADLARADARLKRIAPAGDFRRCAELVYDLALVAEAPRLVDGVQVIRSGDVNITLTDAQRFGISLLLATGSEAHLAGLRARADAAGLEFTADGLVRGGKAIAARSEADVYDALGLPFIPPELREGRDEIARAAEGALPVLVEERDLRGVLHAHTTASDGADTLAAMAEAARERGYAYFGVSDHSQSAHYAGGLSVEEIEAQHVEADRLNAGYGGRFRIFKGIESDILNDGGLDYDAAVLDRFDFVVASIHSGFRKDRSAQTERLLRAIANPYTTILGHMTGRQLLRRDGYEVDVAKVLRACAAHGVVVEINSNPWRLDLDWRWHQAALDAGCLLSINPDAHSTLEIDLMRWGVAMARKGGVSRDRVLNALSASRLEAFFKRQRARRK